MPTDREKVIILPTGLFVDSLLCRECTCRSPFSHRPLLMLAMGGSTCGSVAAHGLECPAWPKALLPVQAAIISSQAMPMPHTLRTIRLSFVTIISSLYLRG